MDYSTDKYGMRKQIQEFNVMVQEGTKLGKDISLKNEGKLYVCGMGGSGLPGLIFSKINKEIIAINDYHIDNLKKEDSVILVSYSGNTEETISCHRDTLRIGCETLIVSSGGRLVESKSRDTKIINLPKEIQPRTALPYMFFSIYAVLKNSKIIDDSIKIKLDLKSIEENGKKLAEIIGGKTVIIYTTPRLYPSGYRWKTQINENAKVHSFINVFSELCHNELESWNGNQDYHVVLMTEYKEYGRMQKRIDLVKKAIKSTGSSVSHLSVKGNYLEAIFHTILLGDFLSYYLALNKGIDPTPVNTIEYFKKEMGPFV